MVTDLICTLLCQSRPLERMVGIHQLYAMRHILFACIGHGHVSKQLVMNCSFGALPAMR